MTFKTAMEHYRAGTASEEERLLVEEELEKNALIAEYLDESWSEPPLPPVEENTDALKQLNTKLRRRNTTLVLTSIALVVALLAAVLVIAAPALLSQQKDQINSQIEENEQQQSILEAQYWDPRSATYSEYRTDFSLMLTAYTELFHPGWEISSVTATRTGFATYAFTINSRDSAKDENSYYTGIIEKNELTLPDAYFGNTLPVNVIANAVYPYYPLNEDAVQHYREKLEALPDYVQVEAAISFPEDITMEQLLQFQETSGVLIEWCGIRVGEQDQQMIPCGMDLFSGGYVVEGINDSYPMFCINGQKTRTAEDAAQHFKSLLRFSSDQARAGRGIPLDTGYHENYYDTALAYVEENGVKTYGCLVSGSPQALIDMLDSGVVSQVYPLEAWINM